MAIDLSPEKWAQVRYEYEQTDKPVDDICFEHGMSAGTLRDRVRRWGWTRRRPTIGAEGPPPPPLIEPAAPLAPAPKPDGLADPPPPQAATAEDPLPDPAELVPRLLDAIARLLPAAEAAIATLAATPLPPREMERAVRALTSFTGTLRELNAVLRRHEPAAGDVCTDDVPEDIEEFRLRLVRRIEAMLESREASDPEPDPVTENESEK